MNKSILENFSSADYFLPQQWQLLSPDNGKFDPRQPFCVVFDTEEVKEKESFKL